MAGELQSVLDEAVIAIQSGKTDSAGKRMVKDVTTEIMIARSNRFTQFTPSELTSELPVGAYAWNSPQAEMGQIESSRQILQNETPEGEEMSYGKSHVEAMDELMCNQYSNVTEIVHVGVAGEAGLVRLDSLNYPWVKKVYGIEMDDRKVKSAQTVVDQYHLQDRVSLIRGNAAEVLLPQAGPGRRVYDMTLFFQHLDDENSAAVLHNLIRQARSGDVFHIADGRLGDWGARSNDGVNGQQLADFVNQEYQPTMAEVGWKKRRVHFWDKHTMQMPVVLQQLAGESLQLQYEHIDPESWVSTFDSNHSYMMASIATLLPRVVELNADWERSQGLWKLAATYITLLGDRRLQHRMPPIHHTVWEVVKPTS